MSCLKGFFVNSFFRFIEEACCLKPRHIPNHPNLSQAECRDLCAKPLPALIQEVRLPSCQILSTGKRPTVSKMHIPLRRKHLPDHTRRYCASRPAKSAFSKHGNISRAALECKHGVLSGFMRFCKVRMFHKLRSFNCIQLYVPSGHISIHLECCRFLHGFAGKERTGIHIQYDSSSRN